MKFSQIPLCAWPGALCIDAPSVALAWAWLLTRERGQALTPMIGCSLFLFVWLIYALDRFVQAFGVDAEEDTVRHRFWFTYKYYLSVPVGLAISACVYFSLWVLPQNFIFGSGVLVVVLAIYLFFCCFTTRLSLNFKPKIWLCGLLFALGVQLASGYNLPAFQALSAQVDLEGRSGLLESIEAFWLMGIHGLLLLMRGNALFLGVGFGINCAAISLWQQEKNPHLPDRRSFAGLGEKACIRFVRFTSFWIVVLIVFAVVGFRSAGGAEAMDSFETLHPWSLLSMASTLSLLLLFHFKRDRFSVETLRFIADGVYLTPLVWVWVV
ncbi:hypothetical protein P3T73_02260 [Kiritimatiellota bacterium B12222]|nr:hypothetical protein P3T73_02260 [Kiritimatiellota bacterium B12222]